MSRTRQKPDPAAPRGGEEAHVARTPDAEHARLAPASPPTEPRSAQSDTGGLTRAKSDRLAAPASAILTFIWGHWRRHPWYFLAFCTLYFIAILADILLPVASSHLIEALSVSEPTSPGALARANQALIQFAAVAFAFFFFRNTSVRFWIPIAARSMSRIVADGFTDVQRFSADWHANHFAGASVRRVSRAMHAYDAISDTLTWSIAPAIIVLTGIIGLTCARWPAIGLFFALTVLVMFAINYWSARHWLAGDYARLNDADTRIGAALADAIGANHAVKTFGAERREEARLGVILRDWQLKAAHLWMKSTNFWIVQNLLLFATQVGLVWLVFLEWRKGSASAGDATFVITAYFLVAGYLRNLGESFRTLQQGFADISDVVAFRSQVSEIEDKPDARDFLRGPGAIHFKRITFGYHNQCAPLYENFSLIIRPGETVALVGPTGSGKSTFVKLVQRLYDVQSGAICVDGQDVRSVSQASLRRAIALVPQDPALFHRTLRENIAYARPEASLAEVEAAARRARAHDFIARLPLSYETEVGERGVKLSGGERQRVALARAFLADSPILILDEATSSLDNETERQVQAAMAELMQGRTTLLIAHRLSTIRAADRILVFDAGAIVEEGNHESLLRQQGLYARLHASAREDVFGAASEKRPA